MNIPGYCCWHKSSTRSSSCWCWSTRTIFYCAVYSPIRSSLGEFCDFIWLNYFFTNNLYYLFICHISNILLIIILTNNIFLFFRYYYYIQIIIFFYSQDYFVFVNALEGTLVLRKSLDYETLTNFSVDIRAQVSSILHFSSTFQNIKY